jgi:hypothetical protein
VVVDCSRCGDFEMPHEIAADVGLPFADRKKQALASHIIRKTQVHNRVHLSRDFFASLASRMLPAPAEASDNLVVWLADKADGSPGTRLELTYLAPELLSTIGVVRSDDIGWIVRSLTSQEILQQASGVSGSFNWTGYLTAKGWNRFEELRRGRISSNFAFFARKFDSTDLDTVFEQCLRGAVKEIGYELRTATQKAGAIDAVMEDEIRRCRFLVADLSDANDGAYWEAGFAEGLGKPVIYICREGVRTHFDTNHRQTVQWRLDALEQASIKLKAVIRNTLLGDAKQPDD